MNRTYLRSMAVAAFAAILFVPRPAIAQTAPSLGTAQPFAVLGGSTVTNTGSSVVTGDLGVSPGSAVVGFPPGLVVGGTIHAADAVALQAQNDVVTAYNNLAVQPCTADLTGQNLGGLTLTPGVYCFSTSAQITGTLTLNAQGNPGAVFVFKVGSTLTTASNSAVSIINGGQSCNIFWQVGTSATLGTATTFRGNILALASITLTTGAQVIGKTFARNGAVTLDTNTVNGSPCNAAACPAIVLTPATLPNGAVGVPYTQTVTGSGGTGPYVFTLTTGALPAGITLTPAGVIAGTPTTTGTSTFTVRGTDANGCFQEITYTLAVPAACPVITLAPATLPNGTVGVAYSQTITASGGTAPYTFTVVTGAPPAGLTLSPAGVVAGTPTSAATPTFTVRGTDANGCFANVTYTLTILPAVPTLPEWAMLALALLLGLAGVAAMRRRSA